MKTQLFIYALLLCRFLLVSASQTPIDSIQSLIKISNYEKALDLINNEIEKNNNLNLMYQFKGNILTEMFMYEQAIASYLKAYEIDTTDNTVLINLANTCIKNYDYTGSIQYFKKALANDPDNHYLSLKIANSRFLDEDFATAKTEYKTLYRTDSLNFHILSRLGSCYNRTGNSDSALYFFDRAYHVNPTDANNIINIYVTCVVTKNFKLGINRIEEFLLNYPDRFDIASKNAYLYLQDKQYQTCIRKYKACIDHNPGSADNNKYLGIAYYRMKQYDSAKVWLEKAYFIDSLDVNNMEFLSSACLNSYYKELGIFYYEKYMELSGFNIEKYAEIYKNLFRACQSWARCPPDKLLSVGLRAYQLNPEDDFMLYSIAYQYDTFKNDTAKAIEYYSKYLQTWDKEKPEMFKAEIEKRVQELSASNNH